MPKLHVNQPKKKSPMPSCGRRRNVAAPHSPFQRLVEARRLELSLSTRELAKEMNTRRAKVDQSTVWVWLHTSNGYPAQKSLTPVRLHALAASLKLREADLRKALDESRAIYSGDATPTPRPQLEGLATLQMILEQNPRKLVDRKRLLHLVKSLIAGAEAAPHGKVK